MIFPQTYNNIKPPVGTPLDPSNPFLSEIAGDWPLNDGEGDEVFDYSLNRSKGVITGALWADGPDGPALSYAGGTDNVDVGNHPFIQLKAFTIACDYIPTTDNDAIVTKGSSRGFATTKDWGLFRTGTTLRFNLADGTSFLFTLNGAFPPTGIRHTSVGTWDGTTNVNGVNLYNITGPDFDISSVLVAQGTATGTNNSNNHNLFLGGSSGNFNFTGLLLHVRLWARAITQDEVIEYHLNRLAAYNRPVLPLNFFVPTAVAPVSPDLLGLKPFKQAGREFGFESKRDIAFKQSGREFGFNQSR